MAWNPVPYPLGKYILQESHWPSAFSTGMLQFLPTMDTL